MAVGYFWWLFEILYLAVGQRRSLVSLGLRAGPGIRAVGTVELHQHPVVVDIGCAQHNLIDAVLQRGQLDGAGHRAEARVAAPLEFAPLCSA